MIFRRLKCLWCFLNIYNLRRYLGSLFIRKNYPAHILPPNRAFELGQSASWLCCPSELVWEPLPSAPGHPPLEVNGLSVRVGSCDLARIMERRHLSRQYRWGEQKWMVINTVNNSNDM